MNDSADSMIVGIVLGILIGALITGLISLNVVPSIDCDLGDNKTLTVEVDSDNNFQPPSEDGLKNCTVR